MSKYLLTTAMVAVPARMAQTLTLLLAAVAMSWGTAAYSQPILINHIQQTLLTEPIGLFPHPGFDPDTSQPLQSNLELAITVTNNTTKPWLDYHFLVEPVPDPLAGNIFINNLLITHTVFANNDLQQFVPPLVGYTLTLFNGVVPIGESFTANFEVAYSGSSLAVSGMPSVPEPGAVSLFLLGFIALAGIRVLSVARNRTPLPATINRRRTE